jgi:alkylhydroperoxidase family enzyme
LSVSDEAWEEAARRYSERQLAALLVSITNINVWNRLMVASRQLSGEWVEQVIQGTYRA